MQRSKYRIACAGVFIAIGSLTAGCGDPTDIGGHGAVQVKLWRMASPISQMAIPLMSAKSGGASTSPIDIANVRCLVVQITGIHLLPVPRDNDDPNAEPSDGGWVRVDLEERLVDLINLPREGEDTDGFVIAFDAEVPAGDYHRLRFITGEANLIYFIDGFRVGQAEYQSNPDEDSCVNGDPVRVPSGPQTGLKTNIALTVPDLLDSEPREVELFFDESTTIRNAVPTGSGSVNLTPVFTSRP